MLLAALLLSPLGLGAQCPDTGQTRVVRPDAGGGYYFYRLMGPSSFVYYLAGDRINVHDREPGGRVYTFVDDLAYEVVLADAGPFIEAAGSTAATAVLAAQAHSEQAYFKGLERACVVTDFGPAERRAGNGREGRWFYLWKKENPPGRAAAGQYLCSTLVDHWVVVLSVLNLKELKEPLVFQKLGEYTARFGPLTAEDCRALQRME